MRFWNALSDLVFSESLWVWDCFVAWTRVSCTGAN